MMMRKWLVLGLALALAFTLTVGLPDGAQAQNNVPALSYDSAGQNYASDYCGYNGSSYTGFYCPMGSGYGYSPPAPQGYRNHGPRSWNKGYRGAWGPRHTGYAGGYRGGWGSCW